MLRPDKNSIQCLRKFGPPRDTPTDSDRLTSPAFHYSPRPSAFPRGATRLTRPVAPERFSLLSYVRWLVPVLRPSNYWSRSPTMPGPGLHFKAIRRPTLQTTADCIDGSPTNGGLIRVTDLSGLWPIASATSPVRSTISRPTNIFWHFHMPYSRNEEFGWFACRSRRRTVRANQRRVAETNPCQCSFSRAIGQLRRKNAALRTIRGRGASNFRLCRH